MSDQRVKGFRAERLNGQNLYNLGTGRYIGCDMGKDGSTCEVEMQRNPDGSITILDIRHFPAPLI